MTVDEAGDRVLRFVSAAKNLTMVGELTNEVLGIAESGDWRRYQTALGQDEWRECEFDYFLIACGLEWQDVSHVVAWTRAGDTLAPLMDRDVSAAKRRPLEEAAKNWHAPGPETLVERAARLGWTKNGEGEMRIPPLPPRARAKLAHGVTMDEHAKATRAERVEAERRVELDKLVAEIEPRLADDLERRYVIDRLRLSKRGRPSGSEARELAEREGVSLRTARRRLGGSG